LDRTRSLAAAFQTTGSYLLLVLGRFDSRNKIHCQCVGAVLWESHHEVAEPIRDTNIRPKSRRRMLNQSCCFVARECYTNKLNINNDNDVWLLLTYFDDRWTKAAIEEVKVGEKVWNRDQQSAVLNPNWKPARNRIFTKSSRLPHSKMSNAVALEEQSRQSPPTATAVRVQSVWIDCLDLNV